MLGVRFLLFLAVTFWGWSFIATKVALTWLEPSEVIALRQLIGVPVLALIAWRLRVRFTLTKRDIVPFSVAALILLVHYWVQAIGLQSTTATNTSWIIAVIPAVLAVLSFLFLHERLVLIQIGGILVATFGVLLLISRGNLSSFEFLQNTGDWLVLFTTLTWAVFTIVARDLARRHAPILVTTLMLLPSLMVLWFYNVTHADLAHILAMPRSVFLALLFLGVCSQALALWFWQEGIARLGASKAGFFLYLEPLATTAVAVPFFSEPFGLATALGGGLVLFGVYLTERKTR